MQNNHATYYKNTLKRRSRTVPLVVNAVAQVHKGHRGHRTPACAWLGAARLPVGTSSVDTAAKVNTQLTQTADAHGSMAGPRAILQVTADSRGSWGRGSVPGRRRAAAASPVTVPRAPPEHRCAARHRYAAHCNITMATAMITWYISSLTTISIPPNCCSELKISCISQDK